MNSRLDLAPARRPRAPWAALLGALLLGAWHRPGQATERAGAPVEHRAARIPQGSDLLGRKAEGEVRQQGATTTLRVRGEAARGRGRGGLGWGPTDEALEARWGEGPEGSVALRAAGVVVRVRREGAGPVQAREGRLVQAGARGGALWLGARRAIEELVEIPAGQGEQRYRFELPQGFSLRAAGRGLVEVRDGRGVARLRMDAREVWREGGEVVEPSVAVEGAEVVVKTDGGALGGLLDPTWTSAGTMVFNRREHRAILLPDGQLLLAGGDTLGTGYCERFDPETRLFTAVGALHEPRSGPFLHRRSDGKVVVVGGRGVSKPFARSIELYDPASEAFSEIGKIEREGAAFASAPGDRVLIFGGLSAGQPDATVERLDPFTGERVVIGKTLRARVNAGAASLPGGKVLLVGGAADNLAEVFDPATGASALSGETHGPMVEPVVEVMSSGDALVGSKGAAFERWSAQTGAFSRLPDTFKAGGAVVSLPSGQVLVHEGGLVLLEPAVSQWGYIDGSFPNFPLLSRLPTGQILMTGDGDGAVGEARLIWAEPGVDRHSGPLPAQTPLEAIRLESGEVLLVGGVSGRSGVLRADLSRVDVVDGPRRAGAALTRLASGRVLLSGGGDPDFGTLYYEAAIFDPTLRRWMPGPDLGVTMIHHASLLLPDGRVMLVGGIPGGATRRVTLWDEKTGAVTSIDALNMPRHGGTASLLPDGRVLIIGGNEGSKPAEIFDPASATSEVVSGPLDERLTPTATALKDGSVLIVGGTSILAPIIPPSPTVMLFDPPEKKLKSINFQGPSGPLKALGGHTATLLLDGRVLLAGGTFLGDLFAIEAAPARLYDPATQSFTEAGQLNQPRYDHQATLLPDGRVLISGGLTEALGSSEIARLEVYDPATGVFSPVNVDQSGVLAGAASSVLPSGELLMAGGGSSEAPSGQLHRLVPGGNSFEPLPVTLSPPRTEARAALLGDGSVLLAGGLGKGGSRLADLSRFKGGSLLPLGAMKQGRARPVAARLASGGVLLGGDGGGSLELLDQAGALSSAGAASARSSLAAAQLTGGDVVLAGGLTDDGAQALAVERLSLRSLTAQVEASLPLGASARAVGLSGGGALLAGQGYLGTYTPGGALEFVGGFGLPTGAQALFSGDILVTCAGQQDRAKLIGPTGALQRDLAPFPDSQAPEQGILRALPRGEIFYGYAEGGPGSRLLHVMREQLPRGVARPILQQVPAELVPGEIAKAKGARLRRMAAVGGDYLGESADRHPAVAFWVEGGGPRFARVIEASDGEVSFEVPRSASPGPGWLVAVVDGVASEGAGTRLLPSKLGRPCAVDPECGSGRCVGGVCCESACSGSCLTCLAAEQGPGGQDGLCRPIAAGLDPRGDCDLDNTECGRTGVCDGAGQCQLAPEGKACSSGGTCSGGSCLAPLPATCDPVKHAIVAGNVEIPCAPYSCAGGSCLRSCGNDQDCAEGYRCAGGACGPYCSEDGARLLSPAGNVACAPFRCLDGRCASACTTNLECAPGLLCGLDGRCRALPAADPDPGCSVGRPARGQAPWAAAAALALLAARRRRAALGALLALLAARGGQADQPPPDDAALAAAKEEFRRGVVLFEAGDFEVALDHFRRSRALFPSRKNTMNMAVSLERLGRFDEALEIFEEALGRFAGELTPEERERVPTVVAALRSQVGELDISASTSAELLVEGRRRASLPLVAPLRLLPGKRRLRVVREGYEPFQAEVEIRKGERARLDVSLSPLTTTGRLRVEQESLVGAELLVDGTRVGELPWEGALAPGSHVIQVIKGGTGSAPTQTTVLQGQTTLLQPRVGPLSPPLRLRVTPASAALRLGDVALGKGSWEGRLPEGTYSISAHEEGYFSATYALRIPRSSGDLIELSLGVDRAHPRWPGRAAAHFWLSAGLGGAFSASLKSSAEASCGAYCARSVPAGPVGLLAAGVDLPQRFSFAILGGYLDVSSSVRRRLRRSFADPSGRLDVDYQLDQDPSIRGALLGLDAGYLAALGGWTVRGGLGFGVLFARSHDDARGVAASGPSQAPLIVENGDVNVSSTPLFALSSLGVERSLGPVTLLGSVRALFSPSTGPAYPRASAFVNPDCSPATRTSVGCAPEVNLLQGQRAYGPFALLLPTIGLRYTIGGSSP